MFTVHFFEDKNLLLSQLLQRVPSEGENLKIKGRKGIVAEVIPIDERTRHVQVILEKVKKTKLMIEPLKKKRR